MPNYSGIWTEQAMMQAVAAGTWSSVPGAPTIGTATSTGGTSASVAFTAPTFAGLPGVITSYTVTSSPGGITASGASSPVAITGLTEGTPYTFTVTATNASGTGTASAASNSVTPVQINYVEEVFSTWLYTGNGSTQTITNGINLSGKGGLVWVKDRTSITSNVLTDSVNGAPNSLNSDSTAALANTPSRISSLNNNGFSVGDSGATSANGDNYVSWTFREQPKFFDIVTYTGTGSVMTVPHSLGSVPGCIIVKEISAAGNNWSVYHRSLTATNRIFLNATSNASANSGYWNDTEPTSTVFTVGTIAPVNTSGNQYVAYLFAHNAGGFGLTGTDNVISCGSFTTDGSGNATVNLGYEPQWLMTKVTSTTGGWRIFDTMRGWTVGGIDALLVPNNSGAEYVAEDYGNPTATGMNITNHGGSLTWIYIAIRRGPMKVPTTGTEVYFGQTATNSSTIFTPGFPVDMMITNVRTGASNNPVGDRLRGSAPYLFTQTDGAESSFEWAKFNGNTGQMQQVYFTGAGSYMNWMFRRAPGFFDVVCYTGTGADRTVAHNLAAVPELMIVKYRNGTGFDWSVYSASLGNGSSIFLNTTGAGFANGTFWNNTTPTASVFSLGTQNRVNTNAATFVAYLFATCPGVSKVGSYTGTGAAQTINCGFTAGSRFVLIKRTDSTGDWYVWDSARGIIPSNDPYLLLNSTAAEVTGTDYVDTTSVGFEISSTAPSAINASGGTFIFLAIA
jgi:hypothetical protein